MPYGKYLKFPSDNADLTQVVICRGNSFGFVNCSNPMGQDPVIPVQATTGTHDNILSPRIS